jgi:hypothetical protein
MRAQTARTEWRPLLFTQFLDHLPEADHVGIVRQFLDQPASACAIAVEKRDRSIGENSLARLETIRIGERRIELAPCGDRIASEQRHLAEAKVRACVMRVFRDRRLEGRASKRRLPLGEMRDAFRVIVVRGARWGWWG